MHKRTRKKNRGYFSLIITLELIHYLIGLMHYFRAKAFSEDSTQSLNWYIQGLFI